MYKRSDAAHRWMAEINGIGQLLPVDLRDQAILYLDLVDAVGDEMIGPDRPMLCVRWKRYKGTARHIRYRLCWVTSRIKPRASIQARLRWIAARLAPVRDSAIGAEIRGH